MVGSGAFSGSGATGVSTTTAAASLTGSAAGGGVSTGAVAFLLLFLGVSTVAARGVWPRPSRASVLALRAEISSSILSSIMGLFLFLGGFADSFRFNGLHELLFDQPEAFFLFQLGHRGFHPSSSSLR